MYAPRHPEGSVGVTVILRLKDTSHMSTKNKIQFAGRFLVGLLGTFAITLSYAIESQPLLIIKPVPFLSNKIQLPENGSVTIHYEVTNNSSVQRTLTMVPISGINQLVSGNPGECTKPFTLSPKQSCTMTLEIHGNQVPVTLIGGPVICKTNSSTDNTPSQFLCSRPSQQNELEVAVTQTNSLALAIAGTVYLSNNLQSFLQLATSFPVNLSVLPSPSLSKPVRQLISTSAIYSAYACTPNLSGTSSLCLAVGVEGSAPALYQSTTGGFTWNKINVGPAQGQFNTVSCITSTNAVRCIVTGQTNTGQPFLVETLDGGTSWNTVSVSMPVLGSLNFSTCAANGSNTYCMAGGENTDLDGPLLVQSSGSGVWVSVPINPNYGLFNAGSCARYNASIRCIAAGINGIAPILQETVDGGVNWNDMSVVSAQASLNAVSCTPELCVAVGTDTSGSGEKPLIMQSFTGGSWTTLSNPPAFPGVGRLNAVSCISPTSGTGTCAAAGSSGTTQIPLLIQTVDKASNWNVVSVAGLTAHGVYDTASCFTSLNIVRCMAMGNNMDFNAPLLVESLDSANNWHQSNTLVTLFIYP